VTVNIGAAAYGDGVDSAEKLVHAADQHLYRAKHEGRNRVVTGAPVGAGEPSKVGGQGGDFMTDTTLRRMVGAALIMLFVYQATVVAIGMANAAAGAATALFVAAVTFLCAQRANAGVGNRVWFMVPALLFTVLPLALQAWDLYRSESHVLAWVVSFAPLLVGFVLPVLLLWLTYAELRKRTRKPPAAAVEMPAATSPADAQSSPSNY